MFEAMETALELLTVIARSCSTARAAVAACKLQQIQECSDVPPLANFATGQVKGLSRKCTQQCLAGGVTVCLRQALAFGA